MPERKRGWKESQGKECPKEKRMENGGNGK